MIPSRSPRRRAWAAPLAGVFALVTPAPAAAAPATERITVNSEGVQANAPADTSYQAPSIAFSADGRLVAYASDATNLVRGDRNGVSDVFVRDRVLGETELVSVAGADRQANRSSFAPALSADGRYVAYLSDATNLPGARSGEPGRHVFVRDRHTGTTARMDVTSGGEGAGGTARGVPQLSADGRYVAFTSDGQHLASGDVSSKSDAFVHDRETGQTTVLPLRDTTPFGFRIAAAISRDARYVVVMSEVPLGPGVTGAGPQAYLYDRTTSTTTWVGPSDAGLDSAVAAVSDDGSVVALDQRSPHSGVVVWERATGRTLCVACSDSLSPTVWNRLSGMSADGRRIAYLRVGASRKGVSATVFVRDRFDGATTRVSVRREGVLANGDSGLGGLSADGRFAGFHSAANNLVRGDTNRRTDFFVRGPL